MADDYIAPWPQENIEEQNYNETLTAGYLREKAEAYDVNHVDNHQPFYGGAVHTKFTDDTRTVVQSYHGYGDSTIWTGTYLASQAFRYWVTGDAQAKTNVIKEVNALSGHLHVTGKTGFISRYWAPQDPTVYGGDDWCAASDRCHNIEEGTYAGDFWWGETSRDQYTGWFFGMCMAYDLVDDEDMRDIIRDDVAEVLDELISTDWMIIDEAGEPTDAAPNIMLGFRLSWLTSGYHITGAERFKTELQKLMLDSQRTGFKLSHIAFMNRYAQYYGNNLAHTNWYNILRLGRVYYSEDDYNFFLDLFNSQVHTFTKLSHNPWFNGVYMSMGGYEPARDDPHMDQLLEDLTDFKDCPKLEYYLPERTGVAMDPFSVFMADLQEQWPWLAELMGDVDPQALEAFPVPQQCTSGFIFQRNPFQVEACGSDDPSMENSGTDYLISYWLSTYHKFLTKDL